MNESKHSVSSDTIGVVIPTKNRCTDLVSAVDSILRQTHSPDELIVIDQSKDDQARGYIEHMLKRKPEISFVYVFDNTLSGLTAAKNLAVKSSKSQILLFIDDDIVLDPEFIYVLRNAYACYPDVSGVGGVIRLPGSRQSVLRRKIAPLFQLGPFSDVRALLQAGYRKPNGVIRTKILSGGLSSLKRHVFDTLAFDENLTAASPIEDLDFYARASKLFRFAIACEARGLHNVSTVSREGLARMFERKCSGFWYIYSKYTEKTFRNTLAFLWRNVGLFIDAIVVSVSMNTTGALKGLFAAWHNKLRVENVPHDSTR